MWIIFKKLRTLVLRKTPGKPGLGFPGAREKNKEFSPTC